MPRPFRWFTVAAVLAATGCASSSEVIPDGVPEIVEVRKIWDAARHNAFTDLIRFDGRWFATFREGERHVHGADGKIRVIVSDDAETWDSAVLMAEEGVDLRDPKLSVMPDGRLMVVMGGSVYENEELVTRRPRVAFSDDGRTWTPPTPVLSDGEWLWRVTWHEGRAYGVSYNIFDDDTWTLTLVRSDDGLRYETVTRLDIPGGPNETTLRFLPDDTMIALVRRERDDRHAWIGTSRPPYTDWTWRDAGHRIGGPNFIILPDGRMWAAGRRYREEGVYETVLARFSPERYDPVLALPTHSDPARTGTGYVDTSYPGLVWHDGLLWMTYYSGRAGRASIYLAKIRLP